MESAQYSDSEILTKILDGDAKMYEILIRRYNPYLYKTGRAYNYNHEDTQDLMQESFIEAYLNLAKFEHRASLKTWLVKIMLHKCWHKRQKRSYKDEIDSVISENSSPLFATAADTQKMIMNRELNLVIENALAEIPDDYRIVFILREINAMNVAETAEALGISESNVKVRLNRAKSMLRREIEKSYSKDDIFEFNLIYCDAIVKNVMAQIDDLQKPT